MTSGMKTRTKAPPGPSFTPVSRLSANGLKPSVVPPPLVAEVLRSPGQPLDSATRTLMEPRFGHDFSQVRVHTDAKAAISARALGATAYTVGKDVVFGDGQRPAASGTGQALLAHELTHVAQQAMMSGHAGPTSDTAAEREAQQNSERVAAGLDPRVSLHVAEGTLHRQGDKKKPEGKFELERGATRKPEEIKNKFGFTAEMKVPVLPDAKLGSVFFLEDLTLKAAGTKESEEPIPITGTDVPTLQTEAALGILRLEVPKLTFQTRVGELSLGTKIGATGKVTHKLSEEGGLTGLKHPLIFTPRRRSRRTRGVEAAVD